jgi:RimJ/RimL family protein N-acetyltransferase
MTEVVRQEERFVLVDDGREVASLELRVAPTCPPEFLGRLPPDELFLSGLSLPEAGWLDAGRRLISGALTLVAGTVPDRLQVRTNVEAHSDHARRVELFEDLGMELFQEKQGFTWTDDGAPVEAPNRLTFHTVDEVGREHFRDVLAGVGEATLDRNDFYYRSHMDPLDWGSVYMTYLREDAAPMWLVARLPGGEPIGFVAVSRFDEPDTATIAYIGVLPDHRGNGYIDDLLATGTAVAQRRGFSSILSDVDTLNAPMMAAMERAGHHAATRPWHIWHHVGSVEALVAQPISS